MSSTQAGTTMARTMSAPNIDMKLEVVVIPVSDVDRSKSFYESLGWRLDADIAVGEFRAVQLTPPGSGCSVAFGKNMTTAAPGAAHDLYLIVSDIEAARDDLIGLGVDVSEVFHEGKPGARFHCADPSGRVNGPSPNGSYWTFATFADPDGNGWLLQEVTRRLPGRIDPGATSFGSAGELAQALRRASTAHGEHESLAGQADANWPDWYAEYIVREQAGGELPS
jgi:catechol 2,3-dioxygenase-like lactoylglutathione lyase family enzyme